MLAHIVDQFAVVRQAAGGDEFDRAVHGIEARLPRHGLPGQQKLAQAAWMLAELTHARELADFLTVPAYEHLP